MNSVWGYENGGRKCQKDVGFGKEMCEDRDRRRKGVGALVSWFVEAVEVV